MTVKARGPSSGRLRGGNGGKLRIKRRFPTPGVDALKAGGLKKAF